MKSTILSKQVYRFQIQLQEVELPIWRCIEIRANQSFWGLHVAIQDAMGWEDCHLHEFELKDPQTGMHTHIGIPDPDEQFPEDYDVLPGWIEKIADYFTLENPLATYIYDFGDNWKYQIRLLDILPAIPRKKYPKCIAGENSCPPEDVGGSSGYAWFLKVLADPNHSDHEDMKTWVGGFWNPNLFVPELVHFDNPEKRRQYAFASDL